MAKKIGNLAVIVSGETSSLDKALSGSIGKVAAFDAKLVGMGAGAMAALTGVAATIGAAFSTDKLLQASERIDQIGKAADRLDMATQALMGLHFAADVAGASAEILDGAMQSMLKGVGQAAMGTGRAQRAIAELGLDAKKLSQETTENQFKVFADALKGVEDPARKTALALAIFGDAGAQLLPMMADGAAGIEEAQKRAEDLKLTLNDMDVAQVERMNDAIDEVHAVLGSIIDAVVVELSPYVKGAADEFLAFSQTGMSWREIVGGAIEWVVWGLAKLADVIDLGKIAFHALRIGASLALFAIVKVQDLLIQGWVKIIDLASDVLPKALVDGAHDLRNFVTGLSDGIMSGAEESAKAIDEIWTSPSRADAVESWFAKMKKQSKEAGAAAAAAKDHRSEAYGQDVFDRVRSNAQDTTQEMSAQLDIAKKIKDVQFGENKLLRAGTAEAQSAPLAAYAKMLDGRTNEQIELANQQLAMDRKQLEVQQKIAANTAKSAEADEVTF